MSILSLRSPLKVSGTFARPKAGPDKAALAARGGLALALGAINPLLALAATVETGPGQDANCGPALREASSAYQAARIATMNEPAESRDGAKKKGGLLSRVLGGPKEKEPGAPDGAAPAGRDRKEAAPARSPASARDRGPHAPGAPGKPYGP